MYTMPWNIPFEIDENETDVEVEYEFHEGQKMIVNHDPDECQEGFPAYATVVGIRGTERELTESEEETLMERYAERLEELAYDHHCDHLVAYDVFEEEY